MNDLNLRQIYMAVPSHKGRLVRKSILSIAFFAATEFISSLRPTLWKWWYDLLATKDKNGLLEFMNYGYAPLDDKKAKTLNEQDEKFRYSVQLYDHVVEDTELEGKTIAEIGCGRGGGGGFLVKTYRPKKYTGIDLSDQAIGWAKKKYADNTNMEWKQGSAEHIPLPDNSIDVLINVESSHCYPSMSNFMKEVKRVLKPGGYFAYCDFRTQEGVAGLDRRFERTGMTILRKIIITPNVIKALDTISSEREVITEKSGLNWLLKGAFRDFAGIQNTPVYHMLKSRKLEYMSYLIQKNNK